MRRLFRADERRTDNLLQDDHFLGPLSAEVWNDLDNLGPPHECSPGTVLGRQGAMAMEVYFVERGLVKLKRYESGDSGMFIGLRTPGWLLGASAVILRKPYPATIETITRCRLRRIRAEEFCRLLKTNGQFSWYVATLHSRELYDHVAQATCLEYLARR